MVNNFFIIGGVLIALIVNDTRFLIAVAFVSYFNLLFIQF